MTSIDHYKRWSEYPQLPEPLQRELREIQGNPSEIEDRFGRNLEFGTGGLRGKLGAGTNRMNLFTVGHTTQGLAQYLLAQRAAGQGNSAAAEPLSVAIAYDSRHQSPEFALHAALVLAAGGIRAYVFDRLRPTPELSFAVRHLKASAGIVITASHNPPDYNGYKVYGADGGQILEEAAAGILREIHNVEDEFSVQSLPEAEAKQKGLLVILDHQVDQAYMKELKKLAISSLPPQARESLRVVYTPLHGTGNVPVREILREVGYTQVQVVPEQELPDPNFSTVKSPNPEESQAFALAIELAQQRNADLILGTDPDADRVGVVVRNHAGQFVVLTGNQTGGLLLDFILQKRRQAGNLPPNGVVLKTIVTSELGRAVASQYELDTVDTLTGFKYIAAKIGDFEVSREKEFLFGYEESYGYLLAPFVRDKDAVQACLMVAEMAAHYKTQGMTLYDALLQLFARAGYFKESLVSLTLPGVEGMQRIKETMERLRQAAPSIAGYELVQIEDYLNQKRHNLQTGAQESLTLPVSDVLKFFYADGSWVAIRPSGTEPKIKLYAGVKGTSLQDADDRLSRLTAAAKAWLE